MDGITSPLRFAVSPRRSAVDEKVCAPEGLQTSLPIVLRFAPTVLVWPELVVLQILQSNPIVASLALPSVSFSSPSQISTSGPRPCTHQPLLSSQSPHLFSYYSTSSPLLFFFSSSWVVWVSERASPETPTAIQPCSYTAERGGQ